MNRLLLWVLPLLLLAACNRVPDHAKYIPKNAAAVIGINTNSLGRKVAWETLTGTDSIQGLDSLLLRKGYPVKAEDFRNSGIDLASTLYIFFRTTGNPMASASGSEMTGILPVEDASKWEAFLKKAFPRMQPLTVSTGKAAQLDTGVVALWTDKVAFIRNAISTPGSYVMMPDSTEEWQEGTMDVPATVAALNVLPKLTKEEALITDARFTRLEKSSHDVTTWINYEQMMSGMGNLGGGMAGMFGSKLYKNAAFALGTDFKEGRAEMDGWYYTSDELKDVSQKMGSSHAPKEMVERLPKENLAGFAAMGIPMEGFKMMLEKLGLIGVANLALTAQGLSMDDLLGAVTGDVVASVNNLRTPNLPADTVYGMIEQASPTMDFVVALKLGQADKVAKLMKFMLDKQFMTQLAPNVYAPMGSTGDNGVLVLDKTYAVIAKNTAGAQSFLSGKAPTALPAAAQEALTSSPTAFFVDVQQILSGLQPMLASQERDRQQLAEARNTFANLSMSGGDFSGDHFSYQARLNLVNQKDNALLQFIRFANRMNQLEQQYPTVYPAPTAANANLSAEDAALLDAADAAAAADAANPER